MKLVTRDQWGARPPEYVVRFSPRNGTTIHWEGPHMGSFAHDKCAGKVRGIQDYHMDVRFWSDIAYNAIVCPHGYVFMCRWLGIKSGANGTNVGNDYWYAVCYLGGEGDLFTDVAKLAIIELCDYLRYSGGAGPNVNVHSDHKATACPGDEIRAWVHAGLPAPTIEEIPVATVDDIYTKLGQVSAQVAAVESFVYTTHPNFRADVMANFQIVRDALATLQAAVAAGGIDVPTLAAQLAELVGPGVARDIGEALVEGTTEP